MERELEDCFRICNIQMIAVAERKKGETEREIIKEIQFPACKDLSHCSERFHGVPTMKMKVCCYKI